MVQQKLETLNLLDNFLFEAMVSYPGLGEQFSRKYWRLFWEGGLEN